MYTFEENILLSKDMHTKVTDFGTAKILSEDDDADNIAEQASKTMTPRSRQTFCGTAEYISPEVLKNEKVTKATDLWALGCIIYQFLTGDHPFKGDSEYLIFKKILSKEFQIPSNIPEVAKDLIENLLKLHPDERLGARPGGYAELKRHPFFNGIDFNKLNETIPPRITPHRVVSKQPVKTDRTGSNPSSNQTEYDKLLLKNEKILYISTVIKRSMMSSKTRALILTDKPRFFYVDVKKKEIKGYIPISKELSIIKKSEKEFLIHTPKRDFDIELVNGTIAGWEKVISSCVSKFL
jgi:3-phosphoinositide dependent protein kinase-1